MMALIFILDAVIAATTLTLRYTSILFVRFHPLGTRYLPQIYANFAAYALSALVQLGLLGSAKSPQTRRSPVLIALLGCVDKRQPVLSAFTGTLNLLCLIASLDFVYRGYYLNQSSELSFSRTGYVDNASARIVFRAPEAAVVALRLRPEADDGAEWTEAGTVGVAGESDWVGTFTIDGLTPDTAYVYATNASHQGVFRTAQQQPKKWTMVTTSCIKAFYPYNPADHALSVRGLELLGEYISNRRVEFMMFLGDFIYIDLPHPLGWSRAHYTAAYRQVYASPSWTKALTSLPWLHVYDDHEIINDWSGNETGLYADAIAPYWNYQGWANPPSPWGPDESYYAFHHGDVAFFVLDTRRYRSESSLRDGPGKTMLGAQQLAHLKDWLETEKRWKVVVSSVPATRNWGGPDEADRWAGYLWERAVILGWMQKTDGVIILSGDRHEHATTIFPAAPGKGKPVIEFSTSALNQFYEPFDRWYHADAAADTDVAVHNHYPGNSKFAAISFDTSDAYRLAVHFDLIVDGAKVWEYDWGYDR